MGASMLSTKKPASSGPRVAASTTGTPAVAIPRDGACAAMSAAACWFALDEQGRRLSQAWSQLETKAAREMNWFELSDAERKRSPIGAELRRIDVQASKLHRRREVALRRLTSAPARNLTGVAAKLAVVEKLLWEEDSPVFALLSVALREFQSALPETAPVPPTRRTLGSDRA